MVEHGARHLMLVGRGEPSDEARRVARTVEERGAQVVLARGDVSREADVQRMLADIKESMPPLRGIMHGAGTLDDGVLLQQNWERFERVFAPKVQGAWLLHEHSRCMPLDFFVLFSSIASLLGSAGQANHAGANAFLDALAHHRFAQGLPALSVNWGPWGEVGAAAQRNVSDRLRAQGISSMAPGAGLAALEHLMSQTAVQVGVVPIDWTRYAEQLASGVPPMLRGLCRETTPHIATLRAPSEVASMAAHCRETLERRPVGARRGVLLAEIREQVAKGLGLDPAQSVDTQRPLSELGLDSLLAVELRNLIATRLGLERGLPATTLFDYPTIELLTDHLLADVFRLSTDGQPVASANGHGAAAPLPAESSLDDMSDEDAELLLIQELDAGGNGDPL